jgi:hypothetical protein
MYTTGKVHDESVFIQYRLKEVKRVLDTGKIHAKTDSEAKKLTSLKFALTSAYYRLH